MKIVKQETNEMVIKLENGAEITIKDSKTDSLGNYVRVESRDFHESKVRSSSVNIDLEGNVKENIIFANFKGNFSKNKSSFKSRFNNRRITTTDLMPNTLDKWGNKVTDSICTVHHKWEAK